MTAEIFIQRFPPFCFVVIGGIFDEKVCVGKVGWHCHANSVNISVGMAKFYVSGNAVTYVLALKIVFNVDYYTGLLR